MNIMPATRRTCGWEALSLCLSKIKESKKIPLLRKKGEANPINKSLRTNFKY
jgi:hypothetical protein